MSLLSSWDDMDVRFELIADDAWAAEDDKTGFGGVKVNSFDRLCLKNNQFPCPWCKLVLLKIWQMRIIEKSQQIEIWDFFMSDQNIMFSYTPLWKNSKIEKSQTINSDEC